MRDPNANRGHQTPTGSTTWPFFRFGLIVTGKGERKHLPQLFRSLEVTGMCKFEVIRFIGQRSPITSKKRKLEMVHTDKAIPEKDTEEISLPVRRFLDSKQCNLIVLIDDLEYDRREQAQQVFDRYRHALDQLLPDSEKRRVAVHFLVNMLEAYYFADAQVMNAVLGLEPPLTDYEGDVETIRHPKNEIEKRYPGFREVSDGGNILGYIDIEHVLSQQNTCASLRALFAWCVRVLESHPHYPPCSLSGKYCLRNGIISDITGKQ